VTYFRGIVETGAGAPDVPEVDYWWRKCRIGAQGTDGFAEVSKDRVSILVDAAEKAPDIDLERAREAMARAEERLAKDRATEDIDFLRAESALKRAMVRIKVAEKSK